MSTTQPTPPARVMPVLGASPYDVVVGHGVLEVFLKASIEFLVYISKARTFRPDPQDLTVEPTPFQQEYLALALAAVVLASAGTESECARPRSCLCPCLFALAVGHCCCCRHFGYCNNGDLIAQGQVWLAVPMPARLPSRKAAAYDSQ